MNYLCHSLNLSCAGCHHPATNTQKTYTHWYRGLGMGWTGAGVAEVRGLAFCGCCVRVCTRSRQQQQQPEG